VPHHLLDILEVTEEASVSDFQRKARAAIADIHNRGKRAILAGGSGLYVRAALDILEFPGTDPAIRRRLEDEAATAGAAPLRARLERVDPVAAIRLADTRRIIRALEVYELTGRPFSSFMPQREYFQPAVQIGLEVDRDVLRERLARRVHSMVENGLLGEVRRLDSAGLRQGKTASKALGYAQFLKVIDGISDVSEAVEDTIVATRILPSWIGLPPLPDDAARWPTAVDRPVADDRRRLRIIQPSPSFSPPSRFSPVDSRNGNLGP
jgi:tRNA dimethylallyltransferase